MTSPATSRSRVGAATTAPRTEVATAAVSPTGPEPTTTTGAPDTGPVSLTTADPTLKTPTAGRDPEGPGRPSRVGLRRR